MKYNFDEIVDRRGTYSVKWDGGELLKQLGMAVRFDEETLPLFTADMDFPCPQPVVDALHRVADNRIYGYTIHSCLPDYTEAVVNWFKRRFNWEFNSSDVMYVDGTVEAIKVAIEAYTEKGDGVMITRPVYGPFTGSIEGMGRVVVNSQLINDNGYYTMDFADIEAKAKDPSVKLFIHCSPHNPSGRVWTKEESQTLARICRENDVILVSDEVHCDLIREGVTHYPLSVVVEDKSNIVMLTAINKTFNTAGLKCSNAIIEDEELRKKYNKALGMKMPNPFSIAAVVAAYNEGEEWLSQLNEYIDGNIDWAISFLAEHMPKVKVWRPEGTYVLWMDMREYGMTDEQIVDNIYNKANVILEGGKLFDPELKGYQRICLSSPRPLIREAFYKIALYMNK